MKVGHQESRLGGEPLLDGLAVVIDYVKGRSPWCLLKGNEEWTADIVCPIWLTGPECKTFRSAIKSWAILLDSRLSSYHCPHIEFTSLMVAQWGQLVHNILFPPKRLTSMYTGNLSFNHSGHASQKYFLFSKTYWSCDGSSILHRITRPWLSQGML